MIYSRLQQGYYFSKYDFIFSVYGLKLILKETQCISLSKKAQQAKINKNTKYPSKFDHRWASWVEFHQFWSYEAKITEANGLDIAEIRFIQIHWSIWKESLQICFAKLAKLKIT